MSLVWMAFQAPAVEPEVPLGIQLPALLKAIGYDRHLEIDASELVVSVLYDPGYPPSVETKDRILAIQKQLTRLTVKGKRVLFDPMAYERGKPPGAPVVLAARLPPTTTQELSERAVTEKFLTLAVAPEDVERGLVLAMEMRDGKPRFVLNRTAATASDVAFESSFLDLCRILEP